MDRINQTTNKLSADSNFSFKFKLTLKVSPVFTLTEICSRDAEISVT
jgi:hypothetical protein